MSDTNKMEKEEEEEEDQVIRLIGNFGKWQAILTLPLALHFVFGSWQTLSTTFLSLDADFYCDIEAPEGVFDSLEQWRNFSNPVKNGTVDKCNIYDMDYSLLSQLAIENGDTAESFFDGQPIKTKNCTSFKFDYSKIESSIVTEFSLVCSRDWLVTLAQVAYMFGFFVGAWLSGVISDKYGRKVTIIVFSHSLSVVSIATAFADSVEAFIFLRWCTAACSIGFWTTFYVYAMEMVGDSWKTWVGIGFEFPWALAYATLPAITYQVRNWKHLQLVLSVPPVVFLAVYYFLPESPRWLLSQGRLDEAKAVLEKAVKTNGRTWPDNFELTAIDSSKDGKNNNNGASVLDLFRTPNLRKKTLIQYFNWFTASFVYYGLTFDSGTIVPGNIYINFLVGGLIEFPAYGLCLVILYYLGRRAPLAFMYFLGGVSLLLMTVMPNDAATLGMASLGKFGTICAFAVVYVYAAELFPTVLRNTGLGSSSSMARVGSMLAPVIGRELAKINRNLTIVIFAATSIVAGTLTLMLPETNNKRLPETVIEGEEFGRGETAFDICIGRKNKVSVGQDKTVVGMDNLAFNSK